MSRRHEYCIYAIEWAVSELKHRHCKKINLYSSLRYNITIGGKSGVPKFKARRPPVFSTIVENDITNCLLARSIIGFACEKKEFLDLLVNYVNQSLKMEYLVSATLIY